MAASNKSLHFSDTFVISCGTVSIDPTAALVLLIISRETGECYLPKGRKNIDEALEQAALRETFEETGFAVELSFTKMQTLATEPEGASIGDRLHTEPFAVSQRTTDGKLKIIFWYIALGDSTLQPCEAARQEGEKFDAMWASPSDAALMLSFPDDRQICARALALSYVSSPTPSDG